MTAPVSVDPSLDHMSKVIRSAARSMLLPDSSQGELQVAQFRDAVRDAIERFGDDLAVMDLQKIHGDLPARRRWTNESVHIRYAVEYQQEIRDAVEDGRERAAQHAVAVGLLIAEDVLSAPVKAVNEDFDKVTVLAPGNEGLVELSEVYDDQTGHYTTVVREVVRDPSNDGGAQLNRAASVVCAIMQSARKFMTVETCDGFLLNSDEVNGLLDHVRSVQVANAPSKPKGP